MGETICQWHDWQGVSLQDFQAAHVASCHHNKQPKTITSHQSKWPLWKTNPHFWRGVEKREPSYIVGGNVIGYSHYREQYGGSLKTLPKSYMHPNVRCSTVYNSQDLKLALMSISRAMDKEDVVCIYATEYYSAIKKNEIPFATTWIDQEIAILSEIRERKISWYCLYANCKEMIKINLFTTQTHRLWEWTWGYERGRVGCKAQVNG